VYEKLKTEAIHGRLCLMISQHKILVRLL